MKLYKFLVAITTILAISTSALNAQETEEEILKFNEKSYMEEAPIKKRVPLGEIGHIPTRPKEDYKKNTMLEPMSATAKMRFMQTTMATMPFSLRDLISMMVAKKKALPGLSFDEVIESLKSKALDLNMRPTGHNTPYKILRQTFDPESPRVEFLSFCDLITMRLILDYSLEMSAFLPCRIGVVEDENKQIWLTTLDFDIRWLDTSPNPNRISDDLRERAIRVRENIEKIMDAAATGDF
ncbi:MAG: DUF302 domain-containing protein [Hyphomicrobiales bacterium]|nr:DUF302 domain-containing protein [Hyphomicrobiales bacterium]